MNRSESKTILLCLICSLFVNNIKCLCNFHSDNCLKELLNANNGKAVCNVNCALLSNETCELFPPVLKHETENGAKIILEALADEESQSVYFNFSIFEKKWQRLRIKIYRNEHPIVHECAEYIQNINKALSKTSLLMHVPGSYANLKGKSLHVDYELTENHITSIGRIFFNVPSYESFVDASAHRAEIFSYVDLSDPQILLLKLQPLAKKFSVPGYNVAVYRQRGDFTRQMDMRYFYKPKISDGQIEFPYHTYGAKGLYYFTITSDLQICNEQTCTTSLTPVIYIGANNNSLVIGIVCASLMIPIFLCMFYMWNKRCKIRMRSTVYTT